LKRALRSTLRRMRDTTGQPLSDVSADHTCARILFRRGSADWAAGGAVGQRGGGSPLGTELRSRQSEGERGSPVRFSMAWLVPFVIAAAFVAGRITGPDPASASASARVYTGRHGDVFRVPSAATRCLVTIESVFPRVLCSRIGGGRYTVDFFSRSILVWRNGNPDAPVFSARWRP
jgi:hypothetical protein